MQSAARTTYNKLVGPLRVACQVKQKCSSKNCAQFFHVKEICDSLSRASRSLPLAEARFASIRRLLPAHLISYG